MNMGSFFRRVEVPRTNVAADNPIYYGDHKEGAQGFYTPSDKFFGMEIIPWNNKWADGSPSFMAPLSHYHLLQTESFYVESGSGLWILSGEKHILKAGDEITIPRWRPHRFESIPTEKKEPLVIRYRYDSQFWEMEERFFRNVLTYLDDCRKHKVEPSILQLCIILAECWMPGQFLPCPIPGLVGDYLGCLINTLFMGVLAFIGRFLYGYKGSYIEYYDPEISRERMREGSKKAQ